MYQKFFTNRKFNAAIITAKTDLLPSSFFFFFFFFLYSHKSLQQQQLQYKSLGSMEMHNNPKTYT